MTHHLVATIRARRASLGLTQEQAAARANMRQSAWSRAESGGAAPDLATLEAMMRAVGLRLVAESDPRYAAASLPPRARVISQRQRV